MNVPCKDCAERRYKCHSVCERYKAYTEGREAKRKENERKNDISGYFADLQHKLINCRYSQSKISNPKE